MFVSRKCLTTARSSGLGRPGIPSQDAQSQPGVRSLLGDVCGALSRRARPPLRTGLRPAALARAAEAATHWRRPRLVFVSSMSDLFHQVSRSSMCRKSSTSWGPPAAHVPGTDKAAERLVELAPILSWPPNVWVGVSIENRRWVHRADPASAGPAAVRFISTEPLPRPLDTLDLEGHIHWLIAGGESGTGHRPVQVLWLRNLRDRCVEFDIPFFFKQWGGRTPKAGGRI